MLDSEMAVIQEELATLSADLCKCPEMLFTSSSLRGRGTTVFSVLDRSGKETRLGSKVSLQDLECANDQIAVTKRLNRGDHPNVIESFNAVRDGQAHRVLDGISGFFDRQIDGMGADNRALPISICELKRPIAYFWGVHDFVRGLRCALLGHQFLTSIGILHRNICQNSIVLGLYPWEERGHLIDFGMTTLQDAEEPTQISPTQSTDPSQSTKQSPPETTPPDEMEHVKCIQTACFAYASASVLLGETHTHFDDVESFLYVLLVFFVSHSGPLSKEELLDAHEKAFVQPAGSHRHLGHRWCWLLPQLVTWRGTARAAGATKLNLISQSDKIDAAEWCLRYNWPEDLQSPIYSLLSSAITMFKDTNEGCATRVSHAQFVDLLDRWLVEHSELESQYSNCPDFKDPRDDR